MAHSTIPVTIYQTDNGFLVNAGCLQLVFTSVSLLLTELNRWMENSAAVEKEYTEKYQQRPAQIERERYNEGLARGMAGISGVSGETAAPIDTGFPGLGRQKNY